MWDSIAQGGAGRRGVEGCRADGVQGGGLAQKEGGGWGVVSEGVLAAVMYSANRTQPQGCCDIICTSPGMSASDIK